MFRIVAGALALALSNFANADGGCAVEVKVLIAPSDQARAVQSLGFEKKQKGRVYFYDTNDLALLQQGLILRVRQGEDDNDLTVKIRPQDDKTLSDPSHGAEDFKCESDLNGGVAKPSFSIKAPFTKKKAPDNGEEFAGHLSPGQRDLIRTAGLTIDWKRVRRMAEIQSAGWQRKKEGGMPKLSLERWDWPQDRSALELSAKVDGDEGPSMERRLKQLALDKDLLVGCDSKPKTRMVLESLRSGQ